MRENCGYLGSKGTCGDAVYAGFQEKSDPLISKFNEDRKLREARGLKHSEEPPAPLLPHDWLSGFTEVPRS